MDVFLNFDAKAYHLELFKSNEAIAAGVTLIALFIGILFWLSNDGAAVNYSVDVPEQCKKDWKGPVLDNPSIKVRLPRSLALQSLTVQSPPDRQPFNATAQQTVNFWAW
jgi:hypothetical protein